jgi:hypothetical protein
VTSPEELRREATALGELLGDTRARYRRRQTPHSSAQELIDLDLEIRGVLSEPMTNDREPEVLRLTARLRQLDPRT